MGESYYYFKADGCNRETFKKVKAFLTEGVKAQDYWYKNLWQTEQMANWTIFKERFPLVSKYLSSIGVFGTDSNTCGKYIFFGSREEKVKNQLELLGTGEVRYYARVWHWAEWDGLVAFLESEFGLTNARWISDEDVDPFDVL